jgi:hypothetical protein
MTQIRHSRPDLQAEAIRVLTRTAHHFTVSLDGLHFADLLAQILASPAANVGGPDRLLASRSGPSQASDVDTLLRGTIVGDPDDWLTHRIQLLTFTLNIAELFEGGYLHSGLLGLDAAVDWGGIHYEAMVEDEALDLELMRMDVDREPRHRPSARGVGTGHDDY